MSASAGTIFDGTRTPLRVWFAATQMLVGQKHEISALGLKRPLAIGSGQAAWARRHRYRSAMVHPGSDQLTGVVEVDETFFSGPEPGRHGHGALGKALVTVAVEQRGSGLRRCRPQTIEDATCRPVARVPARPRPARADRDQRRLAQLPARVRGPVQAPPRARLPILHRVASLAKLWLRGTHRGAVKPAHPQAYLDLFRFHFRRRRSRSRGMLLYRPFEQAIQASPGTYRSLVAAPSTGHRNPAPGPGKRMRSRTPAGEPLDQPSYDSITTRTRRPQSV